ncbi:hypothetical protein L3Q82_018972, partial [Scortum barcoo]
QTLGSMTVSDTAPHLSVKVGCLPVMALTLFAALILLASCHSCGGSLRFASYYGDHMVLQKSPERAVVWGYGPEGAQVYVFLLGVTNQKASPVTVTEGVWRVSFDPVEAGGPYNVTAVVENSTVTLTDVLFGDVWLCGGQSNMYFTTAQVGRARDGIGLVMSGAWFPPNMTPGINAKEFNLCLIRPENFVSDGLRILQAVVFPDVGNFSAVCWLFGRYMYKTLQYPIGLVESCWGGTPVEVWSSSRALQQCGLESAKDGLNVLGPKNNSILWNSMIHPLLNMTIKGALWYQGEANTYYQTETYNCSFPAMIDDWRMAFHHGSGGQTALDFPFGFVQLSTSEKTAADDNFPEIRWHQTADIGFVPNPRMKKTFMAVALDLPDATSPYGTIHPRDKQDVAYRLTLGARAVAYREKDVPFQGPFPSKILCAPTHVSITYDQKVSVTQSKSIFEVRLAAVVG